MNCLVLSAGGMFGAYQAGAWKVLSDVFKPGLVIGASIGALNGWAIAGGCDPDDLIARWQNFEVAGRYRWQFPSTPFRGVLDSKPFHNAIRDMHASYQPKIEYALVLTDLFRLRPMLVRGADVRWQHLAASTAIPGIFDQMRIDGRIISDGGLLCAVPLWAAAELGAERALVIDAWLGSPGWVVKILAGAIRGISPFRSTPPPELEVIRVAPTAPLGSTRDALLWTRENAEKWIRAGERDATAIKHSILNCFERK